MSIVKSRMTQTSIDGWRNKIKVGKAVALMNKAIDGDKATLDSLTTARCKMVEMALRKTIPDLTSIDLTSGGEPVQFTWAKPETVIDMTALEEQPSENTRDTASLETDVRQTASSDVDGLGADPTHTSPPEKQKDE